MDTSGSVTHWLGLLRSGDRAAAQPLWERYYQDLVVRARARLRNAPRRVADEEDAALSAFDSFCRGVERGQFPRLDDREDLWRLLVVLTARKVSHLLRDQMRQKRGGMVDIAHEEAVLEEVVGNEPTPAFAAEVAEEAEHLLARLDATGDASLRRVALAKMEGHTIEEIAAELDCAPRTAARKLALIRHLWEEERGP